MNVAMVHKRQLQSLDFQLNKFSNVNYKDRMIVVAGGVNLEWQQESAEVYALCLRKQTWYALPRLSESRSTHSSAALGDNIYVIGGFIDLTESLNSIEVFNMAKWHSKKPNNTWDKLILGGISPRAGAIFCPVGPSQILIIGGVTMVGREVSFR